MPVFSILTQVSVEFKHLKLIIGLKSRCTFYLAGEIFMKRDVIVVDISRYQQRLDLQELQAGGVKHVIIKAGGGITVDSM